MHAYSVPFEAFQSGPDTHQEVRERHERDLAQAVEAALSTLDPAARGEGVAVRRMLRKGEALSVIWQECENLRPDLLAIATRGQSRLADMVFGSVAESLLRNPPCDVVAVRTSAGA